MAVATCAVAHEDPAALHITEIDKGVYLHTSYKMVEGYGLVDSNGLVVTGEHQAIIVDTPWSEDDTEKLLSWIHEKGFEVEAAIVTHFHEDRTAGIQLLNSKSIPTCSSDLTNEILLREGKPTATNIFHGSEYSMFEGLVEVFYPGAGHTNDNVVVWLPEQRVLLGGCLVRSLEWQSLGNIEDAYVKSWADSVRKVKSMYTKIDIVVPGHGKPGDRSVLDHTIRLAESASNKPM